MRDLTFTYFTNAQDNKGLKVSKPWTEWTKDFSTHSVRGSPSDSSDEQVLNSNKNGPAVLLGELKPGTTRAKVNVETINALAVDIDKYSEADVEKALASLTSFEWFIYTTHKHGSEVAKGRPRLRVVLPLLNPLPAAQQPDIWDRLNLLVNNVNDPSTRDASRLHFLPSTFDPRIAWTLHHPGKWIDLCDLPPLAKALDHSFADKLQEAEVRRIRHILFRLKSFDPLKEPAAKLAKGEPFASPDFRHKTLTSLTMKIAHLSPRLSKASLFDLFERSLEAMQSEPTPPTFDEVATAFEGALVKIQAEKEETLRSEQSPEGAFTEKNLEIIAKAQGWTPDELGDRWIVQCDGSGWVLGPEGHYIGPYSREDLPVAIRRLLSKAPIRLIEVTQKAVRNRPLRDIVLDYGSLADRIVSDLTSQYSKYDPKNRVMIEAVRPLRDLDPKFDPQIDRWLRLLTGPYYEKVVDWMSCAPFLDRPLCAIYFDGPKDSGKSMFAVGMSKLWTEGPPADIEVVLSDFNDELARCPFVLADEEIPKRFSKQTVTTKLRAMLSTTSRTLTRKFRPPSELRGAIRLVLAANNESLLDTQDVSSADDLDAIAQRFLYIKVPKAVTVYLADEIPQEVTRYWMDEGIARHALYLAKNHVVENPGKRFWVEGEKTQMHRLLLTGSHWNSLVCQWLVKYLDNPTTFDNQPDVSGLIRIDDGELWVNEQALLDKWPLYLGTKKEPNLNKIGMALRTISRPNSKRKKFNWRKKSKRYRNIDPEHLISWSERFNISTRQIIEDRLAGIDRIDDGEVEQFSNNIGREAEEEAF